MTTTYTDDGFSTIFNCQQGALVCSLRAVQGLISIFLTYIFIKGYITITSNDSVVIHKDDRMIYLLSLAQVALQAMYYLLFEEFFLLGTIRNLMIWTNILILANMGKIYFTNSVDAIRADWGVQVLRFGNFLMWFYVVVVDGTTISNTTFNVGYNCLIPDWIVLSGYLLLVSLMIVYVGMSLSDKLQWEAQHLANKQSEAKSLRQTVLIFTITTATSAIMMFIWDYVAFLTSSQQQDCVDMFVGNNFPRKILFFILKIITMQVQPIGIYYCTYYKNRDFIKESQDEAVRNKAEVEDLQFLQDTAFSELNESLISRGSFARFSGGSLSGVSASRGNL